MSPTNWNGIVALCAILTVLGAIYKGGMASGRLTKAVESVAEAISAMRGDIKNISQKIDKHGERLEEHETRLGKLEFCLDMDGQASSVVSDVMKIRERQHRRRQS